jgi:hypothetical protein
MPWRKTSDISVRPRIVELFSKTGEIQFSTVNPNRLPPYSGRAPFDQLLVLDGLEGERKLEIPSETVRALHSKVHPGGAKRPAQDYFIFRLQGPSRPGGFFVWTSDIRYLVLPRYVLAVLSLNLLVPTSTEALVALSPSECPYFDNQDQPFERFPLFSLEFTGDLDPVAAEQLKLKYNTAPANGSVGRRSDDVGQGEGKEAGGKEAGGRRQSLHVTVGNSEYVKRVFSQLYKTIEGNVMPTTSFLAYKPSDSEPFVLFKMDSKTDGLSLSPATLSSNPKIFSIFILALLLPSLLAACLVFKCVVWFRLATETHRKDLLVAENLRIQLLTASDLALANLYRGDKDGRNAEEEEQLTRNSILELATDTQIDAIIRETTFFYFIECLLADPKAAKSLYFELYLTVMQSIAVLAPIGTPFTCFTSCFTSAKVRILTQTQQHL